MDLQKQSSSQHPARPRNHCSGIICPPSTANENSPNNDLTKKVAYWVAVDKYIQAKRNDSELVEVIRLLRNYGSEESSNQNYWS